MVQFRCVNCGGREEKHVLPGKHAVLGAVSTLNRHADCCKSPKYVDTNGVKENAIDRKLSDLMPRA